MLSSPVRRGTPIITFSVGLVLGGIVTAMVLLVAGSLIRAPLPQPARWSIVAGVLIVFLLREMGVLTFTYPENRRLVPETVLRHGRHLGPLQFGLEMGTGARTFLPSGLPYAGAAAVALIASFPAALCAGVGFGIGRALMTVSNMRFGPDNLWSDEWDLHSRKLSAMVGTGVLLSLLALATPALL